MLPTGTLRYGASTPACQGPLVIDVTSMPQAGSANFAITATGAPPGSVGLLFLGLGPSVAGTPVVGITVHLDAGLPLFGLTAVASNSLGAAQLPLPLPAQTAGARVFFQWVWVNDE